MLRFLLVVSTIALAASFRTAYSERPGQLIAWGRGCNSDQPKSCKPGPQNYCRFMGPCIAPADGAHEAIDFDDDDAEGDEPWGADPPIDQLPLGSNWVAVSGGKWMAMALNTEGAATLWGQDKYNGWETLAAAQPKKADGSLVNAQDAFRLIASGRGHWMGVYLNGSLAIGGGYEKGWKAKNLPKPLVAALEHELPLGGEILKVAGGGGYALLILRRHNETQPGGRLYAWSFQEYWEDTRWATEMKTPNEGFVDISCGNKQGGGALRHDGSSEAFGWDNHQQSEPPTVAVDDIQRGGHDRREPNPQSPEHPRAPPAVQETATLHLAQVQAGVDQEGRADRREPGGHLAQGADADAAAQVRLPLHRVRDALRAAGQRAGAALHVQEADAGPADRRGAEPHRRPRHDRRQRHGPRHRRDRRQAHRARDRRRARPRAGRDPRLAEGRVSTAWPCAWPCATGPAEARSSWVPKRTTPVPL